MNIREEALQLHTKWRGKIEVCSRVDVACKHDLSMAYTPGVARLPGDPPGPRLGRRPDDPAEHGGGGHRRVGGAGAGQHRPRAALPVMEGKAALFKEFGGVDAFPLCLDTQDPDRIVETCVAVAPAFGGINLEDISAPRCVEIENRLTALLDVPVFHDDQHGTAIVVLAALQNAAEDRRQTARRRRRGDQRRRGRRRGNRQAAPLGRRGIDHRLRPGRGDLRGAFGVDQPLQAVARRKHQPAARGRPPVQGGGRRRRVCRRLDGRSADRGRLKSMARDPIVFALANPDPEIDPDLAAATRRSWPPGGRTTPTRSTTCSASPASFGGCSTCGPAA